MALNPFRRAGVRYGDTPEPVTPYQKAAQVWDERIGSARAQARNWRLISFGSINHVGQPIWSGRSLRGWLQRAAAPGASWGFH